MLNWYAEDYVQFVKECKNNLESIKCNIKNDKGFSPPAGVRDWSNTLVKLAENQLIIAKALAMQAGVIYDA